MSTRLPVSITGKITLHDGEEAEFQLADDGSWTQWGNTQQVHADCVDLLDSLSEAASEHWSGVCRHCHAAIQWDAGDCNLTDENGQAVCEENPDATEDEPQPHVLD